MPEPNHANVVRGLASDLAPVEYPHELALILLAHVLGKPKTWLLAHPETHLTARQQAQLDDLTTRLKAGEPLPYLLGEQDFFGLSFKVTPDVLIPRPETELLVQLALDWLLRHDAAASVADIGTGSGCIACCLAVHMPSLRVAAVDVSDKALAVARQNAERHHISNQIHFSNADLLPEDGQLFDLVCANLPYIPSAKLAEVNTLGFEPLLALDGGPDGLVLIHRLLEGLQVRLNSSSLVLLEIESSLGPETLSLAKTAFPHASVGLHQDLAGLDRVVSIELGVE